MSSALIGDEVVEQPPSEISEVFAALANDHRLHLLEVLRENVGLRGLGMTVTSLALATERSRFATSHHLAVLREAGLVVEHRRGASRLHQLNADTFDRFFGWLIPFLDAAEEFRAP